MGANAIELVDVSKRYQLGHTHARGTVREALSGTLRRLSARHESTAARDEVWSLRDVSFDVEQGDAIGIIGRNGAGKSTLLKVLTRITEPTHGVARVRGRVGALLEVGTGFHPELTGRENVYLNGAVLGMGRKQTAERFDEIVAFSAIERFIDTPVKRYSSGMYLRLAFAVAAHLDADVMLVDEVLAVGDAEFQRKCLGKMAEVERAGRTVLFVSHNLDAITRLCPTTVWLDGGQVQRIGRTADVIEEYLAVGLLPQAKRVFEDRHDGVVALRSVSVLDREGRPAGLLRRDAPFTVDVRFAVRDYVPGLDVTVLVQTLTGVRVLDEAWSDAAPADRGAAGEYRALLTVPPVLAVGDYVIGVWIGSAYETLVWEGDAGVFRLEGPTMQRPDRLVQLSLPWQVTWWPA